MVKGKKCCHGPGYATPLDAMRKGPREKLLYVITVQPNLDEPHGDYLSTVDVDPESPTYSQISTRACKFCKSSPDGHRPVPDSYHLKVVHRTFTNEKNNELHHSGWNACSSCHFVDENAAVIPKRNRLVMPSLISDNIYIVDTETNPRKPEMFKRISGDVLKENNVTAPHTSHCLANGNIMISTMGDKDGNAKGDFILFNSDFDCVGTWTKGDRKAICGYDFWYQPYFDVMVSSEWGAPKLWRRGWDENDKKDLSQYGCRINFYKWSTQTLMQTIDLGLDGFTPLEVRFFHDPKQPQGFVGCCLNSKVFHFKKKPDSDEYVSKLVIDIPLKKVEGFASEYIGGMMSDILLSLDDRFLYVNSWLHGDVRQYDVTDPENPKLISQLFLGGAICSDSGIKVIEDKELKEQPAPRIIKGRRLEGGPQMMQLSLDGKRLYISTSLCSPWDKQFYPKMVSTGGTIALLDIDPVNGGMKVNEDFLVDFAKEPYGPTLPHEIRYPGGDCTSDIWLVNDEV